MAYKKLMIVGAGDFAREIMYGALDCKDSETNPWKIVGFVDEHSNKIGTTLEGVKILSFSQSQALKDNLTYFIIGIGDPKIRKKAFAELNIKIPQAQFATIIHKSAIVMPNSTIEKGVYIGPNTTIAIGCHLKAHALINQNVSIGHDCIIGEFSEISPGCLLSGKTSVGDATLLGSGVVTYPNVHIGHHCAVSANSVVARDLKDNNSLILKPNTMIIPSDQ